ncbi:ADP-ribosyltransferase [Bacillus thuringiensis]|uniref:ADP-ribosyltransferase n=1 Tax=Bacillus thuringiensis TaxID=1428 RepID=UPI0016432ABF|nr:ADP-ribosyltransferase [Bacillus thuringiensis]
MKKKNETTYIDVLKMLPASLYNEIAAGNNGETSPEKIKEIKEGNKLTAKDTEFVRELERIDHKNKSTIENINEVLKKNEILGSSTDQQKVNELDKLLENLPRYNRESTIYTNLHPENVGKDATVNLKEGEISYEPGYTIGSLSNGKLSGHILELSIPPGSEESILTLNDNQLVLRRNVNFKVTGHSIRYDGPKLVHTIRADLIPRTQKEKNFDGYGINWVSKLSFDEIRAVNFYTGDGYTPINTDLRNGKANSSNNKDAIDLIDSALKKASLKEGTTVYRTTAEAEFKDFGGFNGFFKDTFNIDFKELEDIKDSATFIIRAAELVNKALNKPYSSKAYTSTGIVKGTVPAFNTRPIRIEFTVPSGIHGAYIVPISHFPNEKEFLLPRGAHFKVTGASTKEENGKLLLEIRAEVLP